ncbi:hypothetical protein CHUAL_013981 [Chamberlinius hualienensis]
MYNYLIILTGIMTMAFNVHCKPSSMDKTSAVDMINHENIKIYPFGSKIEGEDYDYETGGVVDFGESGFNNIIVRYADGNPSGKIYTTDVYWQHPSNGLLLGSYITASTGHFCNFDVLEATIKTRMRGPNDLYFVYHTGSSSVGSINFDWFYLSL